MLRVEWASGNDMRTFRASAGQLLVLSQQLQVCRMLLNMNTLPDISVYDQVWLGAHWMPGVVKLPLERVVLINHRHRVHNQLAIDSLISMVRPFIRFDLQFFSEADSGLQWLSDRSPRLTGILAEWDAQHGSGTVLPGAVPAPSTEYRPFGV